MSALRVQPPNLDSNKGSVESRGQAEGVQGGLLLSHVYDGGICERQKGANGEVRSGLQLGPQLLGIAYSSDTEPGKGSISEQTGYFHSNDNAPV